MVLAVFAKTLGTDWLGKLMPPVVIGPTVAIIGLSLAPNAVGDFTNGAGGSTYVAMACGLVTLLTTVLVATYAKKMARLIPFILGILAGYAFACIFYLIGDGAGIEELKVISFEPFRACFSPVTLESFLSCPKFTFWNAKGAFSELSVSYFITVLTAYLPVAFVVFAEHLADHENLSSIVEQDLLKDPGLHRTLLGDGVGSMAGAIFGGCPNTTYGESIGCVAITGNASIVTIGAVVIRTVACALFLGILVNKMLGKERAENK